MKKKKSVLVVAFCNKYVGLFRIRDTFTESGERDNPAESCFCKPDQNWNIYPAQLILDEKMGAHMRCNLCF